MRIYLDNNTMELCLLVFVNSNTGVFEMEYDDVWIKYTINKKVEPDVNKAIDNNFTEIGIL